MGSGIRISKLITIMEGDNSEILCFGFSIRLEFEEERGVGFLGLSGCEFNLTFKFKIGF